MALGLGVKVQSNEWHPQRLMSLMVLLVECRRQISRQTSSTDSLAIVVMKLLAHFVCFAFGQPAAILPTDYWDLQHGFIFIAFTGVQFATGHKKFKVPKLKSSPASRLNRSMMMGPQGWHASWGDPHFVGGCVDRQNVGWGHWVGTWAEWTMVLYLVNRPKGLPNYVYG